MSCFSVTRCCLFTALVISFPLYTYAASKAPVVEVTQGRIQPSVGGRFYDHPANPFSGSLTGPSIIQAREDLSRRPGAVDLVPAEEYTKSFAANLKDMLQNTPGVFVQKRYAEEVRLSIRGSGIGRGFHLRGITLLQDGVPINLADGEADFQEIDPLTSRYVEVFRGGNGLEHGSSTLGGVVNIVTQTGHTSSTRNLLRFEGGSFDSVRGHGSIARAHDRTDIYAALTGATSSGFRRQSGQDTGRISGNIGYRLSDHAETRFFLSHNTINQDVPGTLALRAALESPRSAFPANISGNYARDIRSLRLSNKTTIHFGNKVLDIGGFAVARDLFHPIFQVIDQESLNYGGFTRLQASTAVAGYKNDYTIGANLRRGSTDFKRFINSAGSRRAATLDVDQDAAHYDLFAENQFFFHPDIALVAGGQLFHTTRDFDNNNPGLNPASDDRIDYTSFNPKFGALWNIGRNVQGFANISRSSEAPTFSELVQQPPFPLSPIVGFVPLDLQRAWTAEMGTRGSTTRLAWDLTAYRSLIEGELLNFSVGPTVPVSTFNAGDTIHQGLELGLDWDIGKDMPSLTKNFGKLVLRQVYNLNDFRFNGDPQFGDNRIAGIPVHQYRAELHYRNAKGWSVTPNIEIIPKGGWVDYANTFQAPGYAVLGMNASFTLKEGVDLFIDGRNLLDKRYVSSFSTLPNYAATPATGRNVFYPGDGRSIFGGVKVSF